MPMLCSFDHQYGHILEKKHYSQKEKLWRMWITNTDMYTYNMTKTKIIFENGIIWTWSGSNRKQTKPSHWARFNDKTITRPNWRNRVDSLVTGWHVETRLASLEYRLGVIGRASVGFLTRAHSPRINISQVVSSKKLNFKFIKLNEVFSWKKESSANGKSGTLWLSLI